VTVKALQGIRVVELANYIAGPSIGMLLADYGATVIKVESPKGGDGIRTWGNRRKDVGLYHKVLNRNKRSVTADLHTPLGREIVRRLVARADVVTESFRPGTLEKWQLGFDTLRAENRGLILVRVSGFGQTGPYARRGGYGTIAEAFSGIPSFTGFPDRPPTLPGFPMADSVASTFAAMSAMFAIYNRDNGGGTGQEIDVSLYEPLFRLVESQVIGFDQLGIVKHRQGNRLAEDSARNTYETRDGRRIGISASSQRTFERLASAMGMPDLITDSRFVDNSSRCANDVALDTRIAAWFRERDCDSIMTLFEKSEVVAGPVLDIRDIFKDPHYIARENIVSVPDGDFGRVRMQGVTPKFARTPGEVRHSGGALGADNRSIFIDELGLSESEFSALQSEGVI